VLVPVTFGMGGVAVSLPSSLGQKLCSMLSFRRPSSIPMPRDFRVRLFAGDAGEWQGADSNSDSLVPPSPTPLLIKIGRSLLAEKEGRSLKGRLLNERGRSDSSEEGSITVFLPGETELPDHHLLGAPFGGVTLPASLARSSNE